MQLSTKTIIKTLPFDEVFKTQLLEQFDSFDPDRKFAVERVLWEGYAAYYDIRLQENTKLALEDVRLGKEKLDAEFYKRVEEKTEKEMESELTNKSETVDLSSAREKLEEIMHGSTVKQDS